MFRTKSLILIVTLVVFVIPVMAQASDTFKTPPCSVATLKGTYGGAAEGWILFQIPGLPPPPLPFASVGLPTYDGAGHFSIKSATSLGGFILPWGNANTGTYNVTRDCSFSAVQIGPDGAPITWAGTITGRGMSQEIHLMYTDAYWVISGTQRKIPTGGCSQETLKGTYGLFGHGFATLPGLPPLLPSNHVGIFSADGNANFSGEDTINMGGTTFSDTFTGKYTAVNPDCTVFAEITSFVGVIHEVGTITGVGRFQEGHLIVTEPGWVFAETANNRALTSNSGAGS